MTEKKYEIIMWDDINFFMHKVDSIERIQKDAKILVNGYIKDMKVIKSDFTSIKSYFKVMHSYNKVVHLRNGFLLQTLLLVERIGRLEQND